MMSSPHRHRDRHAADRPGFGWTACVLGDQAQDADGRWLCDGRAHGGVTWTETCACGHVRYVESNAGAPVRSAWGRATDDVQAIRGADGGWYAPAAEEAAL